MRLERRRHVLSWVAGSIGAATLHAYGAQPQWPIRPVSLICPWGAGGGTDATARVLAAILEKNLGQPFNVMNRTGGSGVVGHSAIAHAPADGYTLGMITVEITMLHHQGLSPLKPTSYRPLALLNLDPPGIQVNANAPYKSSRHLLMRLSHRQPVNLRPLAQGTVAFGTWRLLAG